MITFKVGVSGMIVGGCVLGIVGDCRAGDSVVGVAPRLEKSRTVIKAIARTTSAPTPNMTARAAGFFFDEGIDSCPREPQNCRCRFFSFLAFGRPSGLRKLLCFGSLSGQAVCLCFLRGEKIGSLLCLTLGPWPGFGS